MSDFDQKALDISEEKKGKIEVIPTVPINNMEDLAIAYTPGVARVSSAIAENKEDVYKYTTKGNMVAVVTDGSAVLGLGNIGPEAALPVMEGKAALFKRFANVDAVPIAINSQDVDDIVRTVEMIAPGFGGINLEDISAPRCFEVERRLKESLDIPVFHDDQHGTAIVVLSGLINAFKVKGTDLKDAEIVINGGGAAGTAIAKLLLAYGVKDVAIVDLHGVISKDDENLPERFEEIAQVTNKAGRRGNLEEAVKDADVFVGVSAPGVLKPEWISTMKEKPIVIAMANPVPEIMPDIAKEAGAFIVATGRSDFPNQINNVLAFPGVFRGALDARVDDITQEMQIAAAEGIAAVIPDDELSPDRIIPNAFEEGVAKSVADSVRNAAK